VSASGYGTILLLGGALRRERTEKRPGQGLVSTQPRYGHGCEPLPPENCSGEAGSMNSTWPAGVRWADGPTGLSATRAWECPSHGWDTSLGIVSHMSSCLWLRASSGEPIQNDRMCGVGGRASRAWSICSWSRKPSCWRCRLNRASRGPVDRWSTTYRVARSSTSLRPEHRFRRVAVLSWGWYR